MRWVFCLVLSLCHEINERKSATPNSSMRDSFHAINSRTQVDSKKIGRESKNGCLVHSFRSHGNNRNKRGKLRDISIQLIPSHLLRKVSHESA